MADVDFHALNPTITEFNNYSTNRKFAVASDDGSYGYEPWLWNSNGSVYQSAAIDEQAGFKNIVIDQDAEFNTDSGDYDFMINSQEGSFFLPGNGYIAAFNASPDSISNIDTYRQTYGFTLLLEANNTRPDINFIISQRDNIDMYTNIFYNGADYKLIQDGHGGYLRFGYTGFHFGFSLDGNSGDTVSIYEMITCNGSYFEINANTDLITEFYFKINFGKIGPEYSKSYIKMSQIYNYGSVGSMIGAIYTTIDFGGGGGAQIGMIPIYEIPA